MIASGVPPGRDFLDTEYPAINHRAKVVLSLRDKGRFDDTMVWQAQPQTIIGVSSFGLGESVDPASGFRMGRMGGVHPRPRRGR